MMFLLRLAFWVMLICLLLPGSHDENRRLMSSAERTVSDVRGFCQRNPEVCEDARVIMTSMLAKLKNGAEFIQVWLSREEKRANGAEDGPPPAANTSVSTAKNTKSQLDRLIPDWRDNLVPADKQIPWRGPSHL